MILATNLIHIRKNLPIAPSTRLATPISHACSRAKHHEAQMSLYTVYSLQHMQLLVEDSMMCADTLDERPQNPVICNPTKPATTCRFAFWCKMRPKFGARLVQNRDSLVQAWCKKGQGICPDLESSGRVDWIRTSDPLTPRDVRRSRRRHPWASTSTYRTIGGPKSTLVHLSQPIVCQTLPIKQ